MVFYRNGNYTAFYVSEPFKSTNLGANTAKDFYCYRLLQAWSEKYADFNFIDSHEKNYNVRDGSSWEYTLKPRLHDRLKRSKNIILFLSSITRHSAALNEEIDYGIKKLGLPVIVVYPEYKLKTDIYDYSKREFKKHIRDLWDRLPRFRDSMQMVPTIHMPMDYELIKAALENKDFMIQSKADADIYWYKL